MENESHTCPACNQSIDPDSIYCSECGTNVLLAQKANLLQVPTEILINEDLMGSYINLQQSILEMGEVESIAEVQKSHYDDLDRQFFRLNTPISKAKKQVGSEKRDVTQLKSLTWTSLKARIKGNRDKMLSKEEQEYFKAVNAYQSLIQQQQEVKTRIVVAKAQWKEALQLVDKKNKLKTELKRLIREVGAKIVNPIEDKLEEEEKILSSRLHEVENQVFVLKSNRSNAKNALTQYYKASDKLDGAMSMSTWDLLGDGMIVDSIKRSRLGEARRAVQRGNELLHKALKAMNEDQNLDSANVQDTGYWMDTFFDGLWTDMAAREKIQTSQASVNKAIRQARRVSDKYSDLISELNDEIMGIKQEHKDVAAKLESERIELLEMYMKKEQ